MQRSNAWREYSMRAKGMCLFKHPLFYLNKERQNKNENANENGHNENDDYFYNDCK